MVTPQINTRVSFRQFADRLAEESTQGRYRLNPADPDADLKFSGFIDQQASEFEAQTGQPKERTFQKLFDRTVGRAAGAVGRGALGAGRAIGEGTDVATRPIRRSFNDIVAGLPSSDDPNLDAQQRSTARSIGAAGRLVDDASAASGGAVTQSIIAPIASSERGIGSISQMRYDPATGTLVAPDQIQANQFDQFLADVRRREAEASVLDALSFASQRGAFREDENIDPAIKLAIEAGADVTNFVPGAAVARGLRLGGRAADAAQGARTAGRLTDVAQTGARPIRNARETGEALAQRSAQRQAANARDVIPFGPNRTTEGIPGGIPEGGAPLTPEDASGIRARLDELDVLIRARDDEFLVRPQWAVGLTDNEVRAVARQEGLNPILPDWDAGIDPVVIREARSGAFKNLNEPTITQLRNERVELRRVLKEEGIKEPDELLDVFELDWDSGTWTQANGNRAAAKVIESQETIAKESVATPASTVDDAALELEIEIARERLRLAAAGNPPPRKPGTPIMGGDDIPPPRDTSRAMADDMEIPTHEKVDQAVFRKWSGARNIERLQINEWFRKGQASLRAAGISDNPQRTPELENLFKALHGEVGAETLSPEYREIYDQLRSLIEQETRDMEAFLRSMKQEDAALFGLDSKAFINSMAAHPDYFPRGWKNTRSAQVPGSGNIGSRPGFTRARTDATFSEILESGLEPASWNPYAMMAMRRLNGVEYREQVKALHILKRHGKVLPADQAPDGWRVPKIGPAFEGRPIGVDEAGNTIYSKKFAVPNYIRRGKSLGSPVETDLLAEKMESLWGGAGTSSEWLNKFTQASNILKRGKLLGSFFQHLDFLTRAQGSLFAPTSIARGKFIHAPSLMSDMFRAQWWTPQRRNIEREILSGKSLYNDFPISLKMVVEEGWETAGDRSLIQKAFLDHIDEAVADAPRNSAVRGLKKAKDFFEQGLFEGVYPAAQSSALKHHIIPSIRRQHPDWTARQVAAQAAENVNIMFSTQGDWQSLLRFASPQMKQLSRGLIFSTNESEGLIKGAIRAINPRSPHFQQFADWYIGMFIFMAGLANAIHFASTGKVLPASAYNPIDTDDAYGPFGVDYNNRFLSPEMPFIKGRNDLPIYMDIVGQMDTIFNWALNPMAALSARTNVLPRALQNQLGSGANFYGEPLQTPGQRVGQAALDLGAPIGVQSAVGAASEAVPELQYVFPAAESRLGVGGQLAQTSGINFRSLRNAELQELAKSRPELRRNIERELERRYVESSRKDPRRQQTWQLEGNLELARRQGDSLAIRAIEGELRRRGVKIP